MFLDSKVDFAELVSSDGNIVELVDSVGNITVVRSIYVLYILLTTVRSIYGT